MKELNFNEIEDIYGGIFNGAGYAICLATCIVALREPISCSLICSNFLFPNFPGPICTPVQKCF